MQLLCMYSQVDSILATLIELVYSIPMLATRICVNLCNIIIEK